MAHFSNVTPLELKLMQRLDRGEIHTDYTLNGADRKRARHLYKEGFIHAQAEDWVDGPVHDNLWLTEQGKEVVSSFTNFVARLPPRHPSHGSGA